MAGRPTNEKCKACATIPDMRNLKDKPSCYVLRKCARVRAHYRNHEKNKKRMRDYVRGKKGQADGCAVCGTMSNLQVHHVVPIAIGGRETRENTLTLCNWCHRIITIYYAMIGLMEIKVDYKQRAKRA